MQEDCKKECQRKEGKDKGGELYMIYEYVWKCYNEINYFVQLIKKPKE